MYLVRATEMLWISILWWVTKKHCLVFVENNVHVLSLKWRLHSEYVGSFVEFIWFQPAGKQLDVLTQNLLSSGIFATLAESVQKCHIPNFSATVFYIFCSFIFLYLCCTIHTLHHLVNKQSQQFLLCLEFHVTFLSFFLVH